MRSGTTFKFCKTEEQARRLCAEINATQSRYMTKNHPAHYTPWDSADGTEHLFIVWWNVTSGYSAIG